MELQMASLEHGDLKAFLVGLSFVRDEPELVFDSVDGQPPTRYTLPIRNRVLSITRLRAKRCSGRYDILTCEASPCPLGAAPLSGKTTCADCERANGFFPAFYNLANSRLSPQQQIYNGRPHILYLAHFGATALKVGIASEIRAKARLLEQGALQAAVVQTFPNAEGAREIEKAISERGLATERLNSGTKRTLLQKAVDAKDGFTRLQKTIGLLVAEGLPIADNIEPIDLMPIYLGGERLLQPLIDVTNAVPYVVSGRILGIIGNTLVFEREGRQYMASVRTCLSHLVRVETVLRPLSVPPPLPLQGSLF
jgi:hypothetical protein